MPRPLSNYRPQYLGPKDTPPTASEGELFNTAVNFLQTDYSKKLLVILNKRREELMSKVCSQSVSMEKTELDVKILGAQLQQLNNILDIIYDPKQFVEKYSA